MIIQVSETRRIKGAERDWQLQRPRIIKGHETWQSFQYFSTFGRALQEAVHEEIRLHPATTLAEAIEGVNSVIQRYEQLIPADYRLAK